MLSVILVHQTSKYPPMGSLYLSNALEQKDIHSELISVSCTEEELDTLVKNHKPIVVAFSVITSPEITKFISHSKFIKKKYPHIKIIWGGVHPSLNPSQCMDEKYIDLIITGQGEEALPQAVLDIHKGELDSRMISASSPSVLDTFLPNWDKVDMTQFVFSEEHSVHSKGKLELDKHNHKELANIFYFLVTSRGCPFKCTFCSEPLGAINKAKDKKMNWNAHSVAWFKTQIEHIEANLQKKGIKLDGIGLWDDMFWIDMERAYGILDYLKSKGIGTLIEARADQLLRNDAEILKKLADAGCIQVFIGAESADQNTLNYLKKGTKVTDYLRLMDLAEEVGIAIRLSLIVGFPEETDESVNKTLDFAEMVTNRRNKFASISGPKLFTPYPGTEEFTRAIKRGLKIPLNTEGWGEIHRRTGSFIERYPWLRENLSEKTLARMTSIFVEAGGGGETKLFEKLRTH